MMMKAHTSCSSQGALVQGEQHLAAVASHPAAGGRALQRRRCQYNQHQHDHQDRDVRAWHRAHEFSLWRGDVPVPKGWNPAVVPGARTVATQLLSAEKVVERLNNAVHDAATAHYGAFYSSELGGIVTDPALMVVHADDHMVHRGHAVFDTALITDGHMYQLDEHLERFKASAAAAGLAFGKDEAGIKRIVLDTAAASRKLNGMAKYWLSSGRGGFGLSPRECLDPAFYCVVSSEVVEKDKRVDRLQGLRACVSRVPPAQAPFSTTKSTNYLRNVLAQMDAEERGYDLAIFVDEQGRVQEGPNMNVAVITEEDELVTPPFDGCLAGVTIQRVMQLVPDEAKRSPDDVVVKAVLQRELRLEDLLGAKEVFVAGSTTRTMGVVSIDDVLVADGTVGLTTLALDAMLLQDMEVTPLSVQEGRHLVVPYGFMTGMRDQLL